MAHDLVPLECEVHFFDPVTLGACTELGFRARSAAAEENAVGCFHRGIIASRRMKAASGAGRWGPASEAARSGAAGSQRGSRVGVPEGPRDTKCSRAAARRS